MAKPPSQRLKASATDHANTRLVDEVEMASILKVSPEFLQKDRRTARQFPFHKIGTLIRYNPARVLGVVAESEIGGKAA